ncbi:MAG: ABC transporter permease [Deltaproteobacteria bacterium]|nr:ABC transporter permease [Deltaproteobacteria bacterium]
MMSGLLPILSKEWLHIVRDRRSLLAALMLPLLLLVLFGYAIRLDVSEVAVAVLDHDRSPTSRELVHRLTSDGSVVVTHTPDSQAALDQLLQQGQVRMGLIIPPDFTANMESGQTAPIQLIVDGTEATFAGLALNHVGGNLGWQVQGEVEAVLAGLGRDELPGLHVRPRVFFNEGLDARWYTVPGLIAILIMMIAALITSQCVAREYESHTIEQLLVSPMSGLALMVGKLVPYVALGVVQVFTVVIAASVLFQVPIRGSLITLSVATLLYLTGSMALGLMISALLKSQQLAMQVALIVTMLPALLLSGFVFPLENMPAWLQAISWAIPARYYIVIARGLFLKGVGVATLWPELGAMVLYATLMLVLATSQFRRSLS